MRVGLSCDSDCAVRAGIPSDDRAVTGAGLGLCLAGMIPGAGTSCVTVVADVASLVGVSTAAPGVGVP